MCDNDAHDRSLRVLRPEQQRSVARSPRPYEWPEIPSELASLPICVLDLDGTLRGDVVPMVRLARPLVPRYTKKIAFSEPWNLYKLLGFGWSLGELWVLRTVFREHRRRYKRLFSELHHLAASLLRDSSVDEIREVYRGYTSQLEGLWFDQGVAFLRQLTKEAVVVLVTGSEQIQTEECIRQLGGRGIDTSRVFARGSLYGWDPSSRRFNGEVRHLNVTLDGKRDAIRQSIPTHRILLAAGNSRPDRALFEQLHRSGLGILVCPSSVRHRKKSSTFTIRKYRRSGYTVHWDQRAFLEAWRSYQDQGGTAGRPLLMTDHRFTGVVGSGDFDECLRSVFAGNLPASGADDS